MQKQQNNRIIEKLSSKYQFNECRIVSVEPFYQYKKDVEKHPSRDNINLSYYNPLNSMENATSIIVLLTGYKPYSTDQFTKDHVIVDSYYVASNRQFIKAREMADEIEKLGYEAQYSPKITYRHSAFRADYGIRGMFGLLINEKFGTYTNIQCILTTMPLKHTHNEEKIETCSKCNICINNCRNNALTGDGVVILEKCIRHYAPGIRYMKENLRNSLKMNLIGCMDCRIKCPSNKSIQSIQPPKELVDACYLPILMNFEHSEHKRHFKILQNYLGKNEIRKQRLACACVIHAGNTKDKKYIPLLKNMSKYYDHVNLEEYIDWAIKEIENAN